MQNCAGLNDTFIYDVRSSCRSCGSKKLKTFLFLGQMPLVDAFLKPERLHRPEAKYPLTVAFCESCTLVQILETVPPEELFCKDYPYYSSFSEALLKHSCDNAIHLIASRKLSSESLVVELASNDGYLLKNFVEHGIPVLGIDPAEGPAKAAEKIGVPTLCTFFSQDLAFKLSEEKKHADVIIANNVLAHVADLNGFVSGLHRLLKDSGVAVIEVPYVRNLIECCEFDTIYHEHLCYFSVTALSALFRRHNLFLNDVALYPIHGGSLRLYVEKQENVSNRVKTYLREESEIGMTHFAFYEHFSQNVQRIKSDLLTLLGDLKDKGHRIAAYGAAAKGTILLNYVRLTQHYLDFVVDRNIHKQGLYMPGVYLPILDPSNLLTQMPDDVLILAWNFKDEIMSQQAEYQKRGGKFIVPIPHPEVMS